MEANNALESNPFLVRGHSDFQVTRLLNGNIRKLSNSKNMVRLKAQCQKQKNFISNNSVFIVCPVLNEFESPEVYGFEMPFCRGEVAPEYIDRASPFEVRGFIYQLIALLESFIAESELRHIDAEVIWGKSADVREQIRGNVNVSPSVLDLIDQHIAIVKLHSNFELPIGKCHGDLTLSNIIFDDFNDRYFLIDFLDTYIDSPLLDLVKISQETRLLWTSKFMHQTHDSAKYQIVMNVLESEVQKHFSKYKWYKKYQSIFEFQNLIRLLPYASDHLIIEAIVKRLHLLITA
ncbi:phosphotransferase [Polynucleobacter sp. CS-Odin-A6]|uniref:phosphotransferase n=1 Tax=Polynucleobacter sp. CS-Odin-A6 TaxID=2689106 RepID=UPI001C0C9F73|nr:phosphotransferase [Polynucleobacter sp. CS-Odin-A6]MBU3621131.1 aminoglycoside phosphotransferase family protein [Polynucleobacter sp. CS-Odin-A6]